MKMLANYANSSPISPTKIISRSVANLVVCGKISENHISNISSILVVEPTPLKNITVVKMGENLPQFSGWTLKKYLSCHHPVLIMVAKLVFLKPWQTEVNTSRYTEGDTPRECVNGLPRNLGWVHDWILPTLPETNIAPEDWPGPKRKLVFQPSNFRCYVSFREGTWKP